MSRILPKRIKRFKLLLVGSVIFPESWKSQYSPVGEHSKIAGYDRYEEEHCYRILYKMKRNYYYKFVWRFSYGYSNKLLYDVVRMSRHMSSQCHIETMILGFVRLDYLFNGTDFHSDDKVRMFDELRSAAENGVVIPCCSICYKNIKTGPIVNIIESRQSGCCYCNRIEQCNIITVNKSIIIPIIHNLFRQKMTNDV